MKRLTVTEAAAACSRHRVTLLRALEAGELHGLQRCRGGRWVIHPECLDAWLDGQPCAHQYTKPRTLRAIPRRSA